MSDEIHTQIRDSLREQTRHADPTPTQMNNQNTDDGGPAFPLPAHNSSAGEQSHPIYGLTKREWFAGMAMQTALRAQSYREEKYIAEFCVKMADAMLAALKGEQQ